MSLIKSPDKASHSDITALNESSQLKLRTRLLLNLGGVLFAIILILPLWGEKFDHAVCDTFFRLRGPLIGQSDIVLVGIDDDSFQYLDLQWPWPRRMHANLLASLSAARARVVVFDVLFDTHSKDPDDDRLFSEALAANSNVILATTRTITDKKIYTKASWLDPVPTLKSANTPVGCIELMVDSDGAVRRAQLAFEGKPSLGYLAAKRFIDKDPRQAIADHDQAFKINFLGPPGTIHTVSYYQALYRKEFLPKNTFKDKLVFIGSTAGLSSDPSRPDHFLTPFSHAGNRMSGIEIHANIAYNLIRGSYIQQAPLIYAHAGGLLGAFLCALLFIRSNPVRNVVIFVLLSGASIVFSYWLFTGAAYYVSLVSFLIATGIVFIINICTQYYETYQREKQNRIRLEKSQRRIREILETHQMGIAQTNEVETAIENKRIKVFFSYKQKAEDSDFMAEILEYLEGLKKENIEFWTDQELRIGDRWNHEIQQKLKETDIALVLVSQAYLDSDFCINTEIRSFIDKKITIMPIMLSPCEWERHAWLSNIQYLPGRGENLVEHYQDSGGRKGIYKKIRMALREEAANLRKG